jgi:hypothetical protein
MNEVDASAAFYIGDGIEKSGGLACIGPKSARHP